ncbi:MAG: DUF4491 family protein [Coriobacteriales bacterium]|jgi:hypothetical protein|nr:DUF4491 family protein [Coriobacteriales bacterium]
MNFAGIIVGACTFLIIGLCHPLVIKAEYYIGLKIWPFFLVVGLACIAAALFVSDDIVSSLLAVLGFSSLWSIHELFAQKKRVEKGWFPKHPEK